jgi:hypothetical protein
MVTEEAEYDRRMKVTVTRSGGIAGLTRRWEVVVDDQPDPQTWLVLIDRLPWSEAVPVAPQPDRYVYRIRCEPREAVLAEQQLTGPWQELVDRVRHAQPEAPSAGHTNEPRR